MRGLFLFVAALTAIVLAFPAPAAADDPSVAAPPTDAPPSPGELRVAIERAIPPLETASAGSADQRECFTCHHQANAVFALAEAQRRGFAVDGNNLTRQLQHTAAHLKRGQSSYQEGRGQGGRVLTAGHALWTLAAGDQPPDEVTAAVTHFLLQYQKQADHWQQRGRRPPSSGSDFTATYVALRGLADFGTEQQRPQIAARTKQVGQWLRTAKAVDTEDRVFRLWALSYVDACQDLIPAAVDQLLASQRDDGGWAQLDDMQSDAYATGTALAVLLDAGGLSAEHRAVRRGLRYLLNTQDTDGTWYVATRADGFQPYFESGFPYGEDQFISMAASGWATLAMLRTLPEPAAAEIAMPKSQ